MSPSYLTAFEGTRILITGHTGFKGSWLTLWLRSLGAEVHGLALPPETKPSLFEMADVADGVGSTFADVCDLDAVNKAFADSGPEIVFHLAAQSLVRRSYQKPVDTYATNVMGTLHVLEAARSSPGLRAIVVVTSDKCYENHETLRSYRETDPMGGADPYSSSKGCAELVTSSYRRSFFAGKDSALVATARAGNVVGGGDWAEDRLVPDIARAVASGESVVVRNPGSIRPWQHVLEPLRGYLMLAAGLLDGHTRLAEGWNFGPGDDGDLSVQQLTERMIHAWGKGSIVTQQDGDAPPEAGLLKLDISKARSALGYEPVIDNDLMIEWTVDWYRTCLDDPSQARAVTEQQIAAYVELLSGEPPTLRNRRRAVSDQFEGESG